MFVFLLCTADWICFGLVSIFGFCSTTFWGGNKLCKWIWLKSVLPLSTIYLKMRELSSLSCLNLTGTFWISFFFGESNFLISLKLFSFNLAVEFDCYRNEDGGTEIIDSLSLGPLSINMYEFFSFCFYSICLVICSGKALIRFLASTRLFCLSIHHDP